ncbi:alanine racemase, partial [Stenotrophomonas maltophilia]|uniref:alanine racemase n=1 Tax=Stenotrophomonas maltophilia TaxID=40324 RepID=UPI00225B45DD|nr:alanine racemase [Stenotrophomonas maltophilia]
PLLAGADPSVWLADADVILVVDSQAPWMIAEGDCRQDCTVIQMGPDPLFSRYPVRGYRADINLAGETDEVFSLLEEALRLRAGGIAQPILLLEGFFAAEDLAVIAAQRLHTAVHSPEQLAALEQADLPEPVTVWMKLDTGMHRLGVRPEEAEAFYQRLSQCKNVRQPVN